MFRFLFVFLIATTAFAQSKAPRIDALNSSQNLIINGSMELAQRGTGPLAMSGATTQTYLLDRFLHARSATAPSVTIERASDAPTYAQAGFPLTYSLKVTNGTGASPGATDYQSICYRMEGYDFAAIHKGTGRIQFWTKTSLTGTYAMFLTNSAADRRYVRTFTAATTGWERQAFDVTLDQSGTWLTDNGIGLSICVGLTVGSTYQASTTGQWIAGTYLGASGQTQWGATSSATFQVAGVAVYPGSFAASTVLPFKRAGKTFADELRLAQRYYYQIGPDATYYSGAAGVGLVQTTSQCYVYLWFPVPMRTLAYTLYKSATTDFTAADGSYGPVCTSGLTINNTTQTSSSTGLVCNQSGTNWTVGRACRLLANSASAWLGFDAEL